ncbi:MAG: hypothetical protein AAGF12_31595 [Myxococcota bacterium]
MTWNNRFVGTVLFVCAACGSSREPAQPDAELDADADAELDAELDAEIDEPDADVDAASDADVDGPIVRDATVDVDADLPDGPVPLPPGTFLLGPELSSGWPFEGEVGLMAGENACRALGADHVCTYRELLGVSSAQLAGIADGTKIWVHRLAVAVQDGVVYQPHESARCRDWTYLSADRRDGEAATVNAGVLEFDLDEIPEVEKTGHAASCRDFRHVPCCS